MLIPGFLIAWITFPGVIVHEFGHRLFCNLTDTPVRQVCYFRFGNPAGYVIHEQPDSAWKHILIGIGPLIVNSTFGFVIGFGAILNPWKAEGLGIITTSILIWLAVSIAMHSFPSRVDADGIWSAVYDNEAPAIARAVAFPLVVLIYLGAIGSIFWLDLAYGAAVAWWLPGQLLA